jgi:uncharacterized protein YukE
LVEKPSTTLYDKKNDDEAIQYLLNSLDEKLAKKLIAACQGKLFVEYFAEFIATVRRATANQVKLLKEQIQALKYLQNTQERILMSSVWVSRYL